MRRTAVQKAWKWPDDSRPRPEEPRVVIDAEALADTVVRSIAPRFAERQTERVERTERFDRRREDQLFLALAVILVMCMILCMLLLAYNATTLSRIEVLLQRR